MSKLICPYCKTNLDNMKESPIQNTYKSRELLWNIGYFGGKGLSKVRETFQCSCGKLLSYYEMLEI